VRTTGVKKKGGKTPPAVFQRKKVLTNVWVSAMLNTLKVHIVSMPFGLRAIAYEHPA